MGRDLSIDVRHPAAQGGRFSVKAGTSGPSLRDAYRSSILAALDTEHGAEVARRLRLTKRSPDKVTPAEVHAAVTSFNLAGLLAREGAPAQQVAPAMLGETIDRFTRGVASDLAESTTESYGIVCSQLEARFGVIRKGKDRRIVQDVAVREINREDAHEWLKEPKPTTGGKPWSPQRQSVSHAVASQIWQMALVQEEDEAERTGSPWKPWRNFWAADRQRPKGTVRPAKKRKTRVVFLSRDQAAALLRHNKDSPLAAWVAVGFYAGLRISESANLRVGADLDFKRRRILVQARKGEYAWRPKNGDREVPMNRALSRWLRRHIEDGFAGERYMFRPPFTDRPISRDTGLNRTREAFERAGVKYGGRSGDSYSYHSLRHTCASWLAMRGYSPNLIAEVVGDTVQVVIDTYVHLWPSQKIEAMEHLRRRVEKP